MPDAAAKPDTITLTITFTALPWGPPDADGTRFRYWDGPPAQDGTLPIAARVCQAEGSFWPFKRWTWGIGGPLDIGEEWLDEGTSRKPEAAMMGADTALRALQYDAVNQGMADARRADAEPVPVPVAGRAAGSADDGHVGR